MLGEIFEIQIIFIIGQILVLKFLLRYAYIILLFNAGGFAVCTYINPLIPIDSFAT